MIRPLYYVWCDDDDCCNWYGNPDRTRKVAWRLAKADGWGSCKGKRHLCPACLEKHRSKAREKFDSIVREAGPLPTGLLASAGDPGKPRKEK